MMTGWQVFHNGKSFLIITQSSADEAIEQAKRASGLDGEWEAHPWTAKEHLDREYPPHDSLPS